MCPPTGYLTMGAIANSPTTFGVCLRMARLAYLAVVALAGLFFAGCSGGSFGPAGPSLPAASDGVQTVSDAADALDAHRSSASENAKAATAVTDALGSFVRDISADQRDIAGGRNAGRSGPSLVRQNLVTLGGKQILSGSELVMARPSQRSRDYCQGSAGYTVSGIPSLDASFGWESGAFTGGTRTTDNRGSATWSANASGAIVQGAIGGLSIGRSGIAGSCPMNVPAFTLRGGDAENAFSIPVSLAFRRGELSNLVVADAKFANGDSLAVTTRTDRHPVEIDGAIAEGRTQLATFHTDALGDGTLTITSTGAQYVIADWIVVGT